MKYLIFLFLLINVVGCVSDPKSVKKEKVKPIVNSKVIVSDTIITDDNSGSVKTQVVLVSDIPTSKIKLKPKSKSGDIATKNWMKSHCPEKQYFSVSASTDTMLFGEHGTVIFISKNSFGGQENVEIELNEYYSPYEIFTRELSTASGNSLLETYGMIEIVATVNGEAVQPVRPLVIHFPVKNKKNTKAKLFYSNQTSNGSINWMVQTQNFVSAKPLRVSYYWEGKKISLVNPSGRDTEERNLITYMNTFRFTTEEMKYFEDLVARDVRVWFSFIVKDNGDFDLVQIQPKFPRKMDKRLHKFLKGFQSSEFAEPKLNPKFKQMSILLFFTRQPSYINNVEYRQQFEKKYHELTDQNISSVNDVDLNYYVFNANKLGLINCDRFLKIDKKMIDLIVESPKNSRLMLVINGKRSYLTPKYINGKYIFESVPVDIKATIVGLHRKNEETLFVKQEINTSIKEVKKLHYSIVSLSQLQEEMNSLK